MRDQPIFIKLAPLLLILPALFAAATTLMQWRPKNGHWTPPDLVSHFEAQLAPLKSAIGGAEAVGYLGDHTSPQNAEGQRYFQLTQYALAPTMVTDKRKTRYFVSVLPASPMLDREANEKGLVLVKDFGGEVRLYERGQP